MEKRINLVVPLMGKGSRMKAGGYYGPKCLLKIGNKTNLEWGLDSIDTSECQLIFITRKDCPEVEIFIRKRYPDAIVVVEDSETNGSLHTVTRAWKYINNDTPLIVFNPDVAWFPQYKPQIKDFEDGLILTFKANNPNYSYIETRGKYVTRTAEKEVISTQATCGLYCFKTGKVLLDNFPFAPQRNGETFVCPFYNQLINEGYKIKYREVDKFYVFGTPDEHEFMVKHILPTTLPRKFVLCFDHSGQNNREKLIKTLTNLDIEFVDVGAFSTKDCDYNDFTKQAAKYIKQGYFCLASCRSSNGINISLNKLKGVISVTLRHFDSTQFLNEAATAIRHNCVNAFALADSDNICEADLINLINKINSTSFDGGRHQSRIAGAIKNESAN